MSLGGRIAEELMFDEMSAGASNDIERATETGAGDGLPLGHEREAGAAGLRQPRRARSSWAATSPRRPDYSEDTARQIDAEVRGIIMGCYERAKRCSPRTRTSLKRISDALVEYETLDAEDVNILLQGGSITREKPPPRVSRRPRRRRRRTSGRSSTRSRGCPEPNKA